MLNIFRLDSHYFPLNRAFQHKSPQVYGMVSVNPTVNIDKFSAPWFVKSVQYASKSITDLLKTEN